ncbi:MAG: hypothetical protein KDA92_02345 [Planctomycetales bacterium]|nr:hypothetical protein [Planctomycetales bacterium]MCA9167236.1 hypothetical protein [Planctomycetales bacterium]
MTKLAWINGLLAVGLVVADLWVHRAEHFHAHFPIESTFGFYGIIGLLAPLAFVLVARLVWPLIRRDNNETYHA